MEDEKRVASCGCDCASCTATPADHENCTTAEKCSWKPEETEKTEETDS